MLKGKLIHIPSTNQYVCVVCGAIYGPEEPQVSAKSCTDCGAAWYTTKQSENDRTKIIIENSQRAKDIIDILVHEGYEVACCLINGGKFYKIECVRWDDGKFTVKKFED